jgi:hypothetical protein
VAHIVVENLLDLSSAERKGAGGGMGRFSGSLYERKKRIGNFM